MGKKKRRIRPAMRAAIGADFVDEDRLVRIQNADPERQKQAVLTRLKKMRSIRKLTLAEQLAMPKKSV